MGVYIKGMEMPTKENAVILITPSGDVWMIGDMPNEDTHLVKAEAVPVPPHGNLKDADALLKKCEFVCTDDDEDIRAVRYSIIEDAPTIIPAEEGKG